LKVALRYFVFLAESPVLAVTASGGQGANDINLGGVTATDFTALTGDSIEVNGGARADVIAASLPV